MYLLGGKLSPVVFLRMCMSTSGNCVVMVTSNMLLQLHVNFFLDVKSSTVSVQVEMDGAKFGYEATHEIQLRRFAYGFV